VSNLKQEMKYLYIVTYWVPFPSSEYGGTVSLIAESDAEAFQILSNSDDFDDTYDHRIMDRVVNAHKFALANDEKSRIVEVFIT
jgi:hypothetical protein